MGIVRDNYDDDDDIDYDKQLIHLDAWGGVKVLHIGHHHAYDHNDDVLHADQMLSKCVTTLYMNWGHSAETPVSISILYPMIGWSTNHTFVWEYH